MTMISREIAGLSILIVDDDPSMREFEEVMLAAHGFKNIQAEANPLTALNNLRSWKPDLILLDNVMPEMTGMEFLRKFRDLLAPEEFLPVIMVTSDETREIHEQALVEGASDFLTKPIQRMDLVLRVRNLLRTRLQHLQLKARNQELDREVLAHRQLADNLFATTARFGALLQNLQAGVLVEDENRRRILTNQFFSDFFAIPRDLLANRNSPPIEEQIAVSFKAGDHFLTRSREILAGRVLVTGEPWELRDGRYVERDYVPVFHENHYFGHLWAYRDVTAHHQEQAELAQARDEAIRAANFKSSFMANMSHEIRTPINGVLGMLSLLSDSPLDKDQRSLLNTAQSSADALLDIINDVLDYSKIEAGKMPIQQGVFSPAAVLDETLLMVSRLAADKGLEVMSYAAPDVPAGVRGDGSRTRQVLANLLSNAIKFTPAGEVTAKIALENNFLRFSVTDTGIGITPEDAARLFQPFTQVDASTTRRHGGTGLGLAISRQLVELMGGELQVHSTPRQGSTFTFTLPCEAVILEKTQDDSSSSVALSEMKILVLQENQTVRNILLTQLHSWRIPGDGFRSGQEALENLRAAALAGSPYHSALVDAQLPDMNASQFAKLVHSDPAISDVQVILMTAFANTIEDNKEFSGILSKPVRQSQLFNLLLQLSDQGDLPPLTASEPAQATYEPFEGLQVLVVDDSSVNREVARRWLEKWDCNVHLATNGREALDKVREQTYDLILMDCQMPELDGYAASRKIRDLTPPRSDIPIIALTAHAMEGDSDRCLRAGMSAYLSKPIRPATLHSAVKQWTGGRSSTPAPTSGPSRAEPAEALDPECLQDLREALGGENMASLAEMFFEQVREYQRSLRSAIDACDLKKVRESAHALKGLSRQFGSNSVARCCEMLEKLNETDCPDHGPRLLTQLEPLLVSTREQLNKYVSSLKTPDY